MKYFDGVDYKSVDKTLKYFKTNPVNFYQDEPIIYHVYWYGDLNRKHVCCIKSYLVTQNLSNSVLYVWLDHENGYHDKNINMIPKHDNIKIMKFNPLEQSIDTPFFNKNFIHINKPKELKYRSDLARIMILNNYGGLYFDFDIILLKDFSNLFKLEFCYQWSNTYQRGNNAILRLKKHSLFCKKIMNQYIHEIEVVKRPFTCDYNSHIFGKNIEIVCYPCPLFDPVWILQDKNTISQHQNISNFDQFFKKTDTDVNIENFFEGLIYAYHWHSRMNATIEKDSYFERIENDINNKLEKLIS